MARNDIGTLNVRVQADTAQFVGGMARAQASMDRTTQAAGKSRSALAALGGALKMPGLGRGAAFGGAASGIASALGVGALGGGVAGIAATGAFLAVSEIVNHFRNAADKARELAEAERELARARAEQIKETRNNIDDLRSQLDIETSPMPDFAQKRADLLEEARTRLDLLNQRRAEILGAGPNGLEIGPNGELRGTGPASNRNVLDQLRGNTPNPNASPAQLRQLAEMERDIQELVVNGMRTIAIQEAAAQREIAAQQDGGPLQDSVDNLVRSMEDWQRANQRASDQIATVASRISSQITQLTFRRD